MKQILIKMNKRRLWTMLTLVIVIFLLQGCVSMDIGTSLPEGGPLEGNATILKNTDAVYSYTVGVNYHGSCTFLMCAAEDDPAPAPQYTGSIEIVDKPEGSHPVISSFKTHSSSIPGPPTQSNYPAVQADFTFNADLPGQYKLSITFNASEIDDGKTATDSYSDSILITVTD